MALHPALENLRELFLRRTCPGCGAEPLDPGAALCCWCSLRLYSHGPAGSAPPGCGIRAHGVFSHTGLPRELVLRFKYNGERHLARCAAQLMIRYSPVHPSPGSTVVPVPASRERLRERGYNHAGLLARNLSRLTGSHFEKLLDREERPPQVGLGELDRRTNISGAFSAVTKVEEDTEVWLIDDVMTTGSTICDATRALVEGGAGSVRALTLTYRDTLSASII